MIYRVPRGTSPCRRVPFLNPKWKFFEHCFSSASEGFCWFPVFVCLWGSQGDSLLVTFCKQKRKGGTFVFAHTYSVLTRCWGSGTSWRARKTRKNSFWKFIFFAAKKQPKPNVWIGGCFFESFLEPSAWLYGDVIFVFFGGVPGTAPAPVGSILEPFWSCLILLCLFWIHFWICLTLGWFLKPKRWKNISLFLSKKAL